MSRDRYVRLGAVMVGVLVLALLPLVLSDYWLYLCSTAVITAIVARGVGVVTGQAGMITLAQMSFVGAGAWVACWLNVHVPGAPFLLVLLIAGVSMVPLGVAVGLPALRLRGVNLGVVTLAFAVAMTGIFTTKGFPGQSTRQTLLLPDWLSDAAAFYLFCLAVALGVFVVLACVSSTRTGAGWAAVRHSERATAALGVRVPATKLSAFAAAAFLAGIAGAMLAFELGTVSASAFGVVPSLVIFALAVFVGAQYAVGALFAGALSVFFPELLSSLGIAQDVGNMLFALGAVQALRAGRSIAEDVRFQGRLLARRFGRGSRARTAVTLQRPVIIPPAPRGNGAVLLSVRCLGVRYDNVRALDDVTFDVHKATVHGLIGPNGAGKSTFVDAVSGFLPHYDGDIVLDGRSLGGSPPHVRAHLGIRRSFQQDRAIPELTVGHYIRLAARREVGSRELDELIRWLGCPAADHRIAEIDVGSRRMVEVAGVLAAKPRIVVLDEPAAGLGEDASLALAARLVEVPARFGTSVLLIDHDMDLVQAACATITVLDFGRVIGQGSPADVLADRRVVAAYLGEEILGDPVPESADRGDDR